MDTKTRILESALKLYNEKGIDATTRHIAAGMGISAGNLHYHFKHTDDIIITLWDQLATEFDQLVSRLGQATEISLDSLHSFYYQSFQTLYKYRFIFLHFVAIGIRIPTIQEHYRSLMQRREKEFKAIFRILIRNGIFRKDIPEAVWTALVRQIFIVSDFWLSNNELTDRLRDKEAAIAFTKQMESMFFPYLSKS
ncbi:MAG: TetR/AcrR family transcriptional regulator [Chitinophagaceae bacterium]|nr:TetR/AcrR family transcriptional regulator [Chitinophagaceae bacterium]